jgi:hypothetical protein
MVGQNVLHTIPVTITKAAGVAANRFIAYGGDYPSGDGEACPGSLMFAASLNQQADVAVFGVAIVESSGTIHVGGKIMCEASTGKAKAYSGTYGSVYALGKSLDEASAGEFIRVLLS